jgi:hypothetical protein
MTRGILIVGNESPTFDAVVSSAHARVDCIVRASVPNRLKGVSSASAASAGKSADTVLPWNPPSPVSARTLIVGAENRMGRIDEAVLVCAPPAIRRRADELVPAETDILVDDLIKGWFLVVRELAVVFRTRKSGTLVLALSEGGLGGGKDDAPDLFGGAVAAAFRAFAQGLLAASFKEPYRVLAFSAAEAGDDVGFGDFIFKTLDDGNKRDAGRWHKYGKGGLFGLI